MIHQVIFHHNELQRKNIGTNLTKIIVNMAPPRSCLYWSRMPITINTTGISEYFKKDLSEEAIANSEYLILKVIFQRSPTGSEAAIEAYKWQNMALKPLFHSHSPTFIKYFHGRLEMMGDNY